MSKPLVSVFLGNYNHAKYLKQCFRGFQCQTYENFEIVITDDGSTDDSVALIREYAAQDPRIKPNFFPKNRGIRASFIDATNRIAGKYVYPSAADDFVVNKDFFQKAVDALETEPRPAGYYGITGVYVAEKEKLTGGMGTAVAPGCNTPLQCYEGFLKCRAVVTSPSCIFRTDMYMAGGGREMGALIDRFGPQMDFYLNHALAARHGMIFENTLFACQRVFEAKTNYSSNQHLWATAERFAELEKGLREVGLTYPEMETDWVKWRAFWMMDTIKKSGALAA
jgi:glycosyltransferase involved in cell wall biosynthesis